MNLTHKKPLIAAIAIGVGLLTPGLSQAAPTAVMNFVDSTAADYQKPVYYPTEMASESTSGFTAVFDAAGGDLVLDSALAVRFPVIPSYQVNVAQGKPLAIRISLTGGAKFKTAKKPVLICGHSAGTTVLKFDGAKFADSKVAATDDKLVQIPANDFGADTAVVSFAVPDGWVTNASGCLLTYTASNDAAAVDPDNQFVALAGAGGGQDVNMIVELTYKELFATAVKTSMNGTIIKFVTAFKAEAKAQTIEGSKDTVVTIDVNQSSKKFVAQTAANFPGRDDLVVAGYVRIVPAQDDTVNSRMYTLTGGSLTAIDGNSTNAGHKAINILTGAVVTLSGPLFGGASTVSLEDDTACGGTKLDSYTPTVAASGSATVSVATFNLSATDIPELRSGRHVCVKVAGTNELTDGQLTASLEAQKKGVTTLFELGSGNLANVDRNGSVIRVLNIPNTTTTADRAFIRFYNVTKQDIVVKGTVYGEDGKPVCSDIPLFDNALKYNDPEVLTSEDLGKRCGKMWEKRAWLMIQAPAAPGSLRVQALVRTPSNVLVNLSTDAGD
jgi:hypothetical protein